MQKIVIVEPGSSAIHIANAVRTLNYEPVILCSISEYGGDQKKYLQKHGYYEVCANKVDNIVQCINENKITNILGVISTADRFIPQAYKAAMSLGVKGMDPALLKLNNKAEVIRFIKEDSPPSIVFNKNAIPYTELKDMLKGTSALIFKPSLSAGAKGLFEIKTEKDVDNVYEFMKKEKEVQVLDQDWVAQPVINGVLYSLEGFVANEKINYIGLSRRTRIKYTETQNIFPVEDEIEPKIFSDFQKILGKLVKASGYKNGYFHSEIIFDGKRSFLIDANFGRIGGGSIAMQIAKSTGKSVEEIYAHVIDVTFFGNKKNHTYFYPKEKSKTLSILYGINKNSTLVEINLPNNIKSHHVRLADIGKYLNSVGYNNRSWIGILIGTPEDVLIEIEQISICTDNGVLKPVF